MGTIPSSLHPETDEEGRILSFQEKPSEPYPFDGGTGTCPVSMGVCAFESRAF